MESRPRGASLPRQGHRRLRRRKVQGEEGNETREAAPEAFGAMEEILPQKMGEFNIVHSPSQGGIMPQSLDDPEGAAQAAPPGPALASGNPFWREF